MDQPLTRWYCDVCGEPIDDVHQGYVTWRHDEQLRDGGFKIIHKKKCDRREDPSSSPLADFLGIEGLNKILSMVTYGPLVARGAGQNPGVMDMDEFVDFIRRVQVPFYEEARRRFSEGEVQEHWAGANERLPYMQDSLRQTIEL